MLLTLFRHGIAHDREDPDCPPDPDRALTSKGWRRTEAAARGLALVAARPALIVSSPWKRAEQTARLAAQALGLERRRTRFSEALLPDREPAEGLALLRELGEGDVLLCGHAPQLDELLAAAIGCPFPLGRLKKAGAACVEWNTPGAGTGRLRWWLEPSTLRRLGKD